MKSFLKTASRAVAALFAVALVTMGVASPAFADDGAGAVTAGSITIERGGMPTGETYDNLADATAAARSGDTIKLGEGEYTLYKVPSEDHTKGKNLTFEGLSTDKTTWQIGPKFPSPNEKGEYNSDYSFQDAGTVTFKNMTLHSARDGYLGFSHTTNTVVDHCVIKGHTRYWGYETAVFKSTTFEAPFANYAIWTYSSPIMTFEDCTFNASASGKMIKVYTDYSAGSHNITVNVKNCTFNSISSKSDTFYKQALSIDDSNMGNVKYILNITKSSAKAQRDNTTCSQLFGFGNKSEYNKGHTDVNIDGELVWSKSQKLTHSYTDGEHEDKFKDENNYVWEQKPDGLYCTGHAKCGYCGYEIAETVKATSVDKATCTEKGTRTYTATFSHKCFEAQTKAEEIAALGHDWGEPEYSWTKQDDGWHCTAKRVCKRDPSHVDEQTVKATVKTTPATCLEEGESVYTAKFDGDVFKPQAKTEEIAALGHDWGEPEYSWTKQDDGWHCTAKRVCKRDPSQVEKETVKATYEVTTPATTEKEGEGTYTATFENEAFEPQTKTEPISKLPVKPQDPAKPKDDKPSKTDKPNKSGKTNKQTLPGTGDSTASVIMAMLSMAAICFAGSAIASKMRKCK